MEEEKSRTEECRTEEQTSREGYFLTDPVVEEYCWWLGQSEKSRGTIQKYRYYLKQFQEYAGGREVNKELVIEWKETLKRRLAPVTVNGALAAINGLFAHAGWENCRVKLVRCKRQIFCQEDRELSKREYERLVRAAQAEGNDRMACLLQAVCATGIRISELAFLTVEALKRRSVQVDCKGKVRQIILTKELCRLLNTYAKRYHIISGAIFITRSGRPMDRSNIWREMKKLARKAGVDSSKVFPHNLRHLFARVYYSLEKDLFRLSDILGHSNVNTTRIYTIGSGGEHIRQMERMKLLI